MTGEGAQKTMIDQGQTLGLGNRFLRALGFVVFLMALTSWLRPCSAQVANLPELSEAIDGDSEGDGDSESPSDYRVVKRLNAGLPPPKQPIDLTTPQASLENFLLSADRGEYAQAAHSLNLNAIPLDQQPEVGLNRATELKAVMDQELWVDWSAVPDRQDGQVDDRSAMQERSGEARGPQPSLLLGRIYLGERDVEIRLERLKPAGGPPVWVFSRQTVAHIPELYQKYAPGWLQRVIPDFLKELKIGPVALWQWIGFAIVLAVGALLGWLVHQGLDALGQRIESARVRAVASAIRGPGALAIGLATAYGLARGLLSLAGPILSTLQPLYIAVIILCVAWFFQRLTARLSTAVSQRYERHGGDEANVWITRVVVIRHVTTFLIFLLGVTFALSRFEWFRQFGPALLASAGVLGVVLGIAAQRVVGNLFAGFVLALTQPVKVGDAVLFEGEFGWIEEIVLTFVVIRTWDLRRLIVPIAYLLDHPLENWSRRSQQMIKPVEVYADYRVDIDSAREELKRILEDSPDWDKQVPPILEVTDSSPTAIQLRALCSASDPGAAWRLHCRVREGLITFLRQQESGRYLPRNRVALVDQPLEDSESQDGHLATVPAHQEAGHKDNGGSHDS